eukprot:626092-Pyramimonas_sp.AAC.1
MWDDSKYRSLGCLDARADCFCRDATQKGCRLLFTRCARVHVDGAYSREPATCMGPLAIFVPPS